MRQQLKEKEEDWKKKEAERLAQEAQENSSKSGENMDVVGSGGEGEREKTGEVGAGVTEQSDDEDENASPASVSEWSEA
jgi:hypothetical protein